MVNKPMKKLLIVILFLVSSFNAFTGCKTPTEPEQTIMQETAPAFMVSPTPSTTPSATPNTVPNTTPSTVPSTVPSTAPSTIPSATPSREEFPFTEENFPRIDGSTATIPLIEAVTSALLGKPRSEIDVNVNKTSGAYAALAQNDADILLVYDGGDETRALVKADELFETVSIGKDALVFLVNRDNPVENLSTGQIQKIFSGEYTNWREIGGKDEPIRAFQRGEGAGSQALMDKLVMPGLAMADPAMVPVIGDMSGLIDAVADFTGGPTGIGYNVYFYVTEMRGNDYVKILSIDGVTPSYDTIQSGEYPFVSDFYSVIRKDEPADSPTRALHEWMLTDEAQNLIASENYVALHTNSDVATPYVDGKFSLYPAGEAPEYFIGTDSFAFKARNDYGQLYFYLGATRREEWSDPRYYGLCTANGKIVTEPLYSVPLLLTDSKGNKMYFCYRSDREPLRVAAYNEAGELIHEISYYPALLFATDGSWIKEFDSARPFFGFTGPTDAIRNADVLAVMLGGKWGAVNMRGEKIIPFDRDGYQGIYPPPDGGIGALGLTGDRFLRSTGEYFGGSGPFDLYSGNGKLIATGLRGYPQGMAGEFIVTAEWDNELYTVYTYTLDGELIATLTMEEHAYGYAEPFNDYVLIYAEKSLLISDRELNILHEFSYEYDARYGRLMSPFTAGPNVLYRSDNDTLFHRTYLPDGTRLVTWYDPDME